MNGALLTVATAALDRAGARYALIGAAALAAHGVARSTFDVDLLTTDPRVLDPAVWAEAADDPRITVSVRTGDADDPLAGVIRLEAEGQRAIDVVVGRGDWQAEAVAAARIVEVAGVTVPVVGVADLILLKLYAGGSQDLWDISQLLAAADDPTLIGEVEARLVRLPRDARRAWTQVLRDRI